MVYELRCYTLVPGKMPEYLKAAETIGRPARGNNYGVNHGYWTAEFGALNQIWHLWKYDSLNDRERLRGELHGGSFGTGGGALQQLAAGKSAFDHCRASLMRMATPRKTPGTDRIFHDCVQARRL